MKKAARSALAAIVFSLVFLTTAPAQTIQFSADELTAAEQAKIDALAFERWGSDAVTDELFVYHNYNDRPFVLVVKCVDSQTGETLGCLYLDLRSLEPLEIIMGEPLHEGAFSLVMQWVESPGATLSRVYYLPGQYPILKLRTANRAGDPAFLLADPEQHRLISPNVLQRLALRAQSFLQALGSLTGFQADSDNGTDDEGWNKVLLDVIEVNTYLATKEYGCGPNAMLNVLGYWNDKGCKVFADEQGKHVPTGDAEIWMVDELLSELNTKMGTSSGGYTFSNNLNSGATEFLTQHSLKGTITHSMFYSFDDVIAEIDADRPCILGSSLSPTSEFFAHFAAVVGYRVPTTWYGRKYVLLHDGYHSTYDVREQRWIGSFFDPFNFHSIKLQCGPSNPSFTLAIQGNYKQEQTNETKDYTGELGMEKALTSYGSWKGNTFTAGWGYTNNQGKNFTGSATIILSDDKEQVTQFTFREDMVWNDDFYGYVTTSETLEAGGLVRTQESDSAWVYSASGRSACDAITEVDYRGQSPNYWGSGNTIITLQNKVCDDESRLEIKLTAD